MSLTARDRAPFTAQPRNNRRHPNATNRRRAQRYPIDLELTYQLLRPNGVTTVGTGRTVNLSSGGILFEGAHELPAGSIVQIAMAWPARLEDVVPLTLSAAGEVVRSQGTRTAIRIKRHDFRTRARAGKLHV